MLPDKIEDYMLPDKIEDYMVPDTDNPDSTYMNQQPPADEGNQDFYMNQVHCYFSFARLYYRAVIGGYLASVLDTLAPPTYLPH